MNLENLVIELKGTKTIKSLRDLIGKSDLPDDDEARTILVSLCKELTDALENPAKHHAYGKPRVMPWMKL